MMNDLQEKADVESRENPKKKRSTENATERTAFIYVVIHLDLFAFILGKGWGTLAQ